MMLRANMGVLVQPMRWLAVYAAMATTLVPGLSRLRALRAERLRVSCVSSTWLEEHRRRHRYN